MASLYHALLSSLSSVHLALGGDASDPVTSSTVSRSPTPPPLFRLLSLSVGDASVSELRMAPLLLHGESERLLEAEASKTDSGFWWFVEIHGSEASFENRGAGAKSR